MSDNCERCHKEILEDRAIIISPSIEDYADKFYLCLECYFDLYKWLIAEVKK